VCQKSLKDAAILCLCQSRGLKTQQSRGTLLLGHGVSDGRGSVSARDCAPLGRVLCIGCLGVGDGGVVEGRAVRRCSEWSRNPE
jgi:hypothetical protein